MRPVTPRQERHSREAKKKSQKAPGQQAERAASEAGLSLAQSKHGTDNATRT